ncbi:MAG TPA: phosphoenolpyruvate--protein phosphotransferase [Candidatus Avimonoglobus intestinipullorum]|uniref:Phosphoenolpyruvate-protein phosphotransferase n=1 Tax=Candidatus Avimonoglobus intestinipullorum TaxID=2840699 RepID=A0A9D1LUP0_9FIRM|nr:phosphoenolpyruvate--protein phosphotransferase [Candidatus Avimonoglobus intestinipullorum]
MVRGINASAGIGIGTVAIVGDQQVAYTPFQPEDPAAEVKRFENALSEFSAKTFAMAEELRKKAGEKEAEILMGHAVLISDPALTEEIKKKINAGMCAEAALEAVLDMFIDMFGATGDELTQQRVTDLKDIKTGMLKTLLHIEDLDLSNLKPDTILVAHDLTPSMTATLNKEHVVGIVTEEGGKTSHSAILARSMEIPAVLSVRGIVSELHNGDQIIVDGIEGAVLIRPSDSQVIAYRKKREAYLEEKRALGKFVGKETRTDDGKRFELFCNIGTSAETAKVLEYDGEGVGLFRTEFLFMDRTQVPSEEEQFEAYRQAAEGMRGRPVIIRTLDIGGDKEIPYLGLEKEENPFLGYRAIRFCLKRKDLFRAQLRALLRASAFGDIRIMLPLVTCVEEVREAKALLADVESTLEQDGIQYKKNVPVGVMIETPAAALIADLLAEEADFFSIGTNDLTQYTMAVDRGNAKVSYLYSAYNPAVLRSIRHIIKTAKEKHIPVGMCGEAASDPHLIPLLIAFGLDEFSVSPAAVLQTRKIIAAWDSKKASEAAQHALELKTEREVAEYLESLY